MIKAEDLKKGDKIIFTHRVFKKESPIKVTGTICDFSKNGVDVIVNTEYGVITTGEWNIIEIL